LELERQNSSGEDEAMKAKKAHRNAIRRKTGLRAIRLEQLVEVSPAIDFDCMQLKEGEQAPEGWMEVHISADDLPIGWPPEKPYDCPCGCHKTIRIGDRIAVRNVKETGGRQFVHEIAGKGYVIKFIAPNSDAKYIAPAPIGADENFEDKLFDSFQEASKFPYRTVEAAVDVICGLPTHIDFEIVLCAANEPEQQMAEGDRE
jgi:hypothetical protein